ncbi:hypothetical protein U9M48_035184 [Paspalum notatum var. saurae]|uniref:Uncharacterized protein n=1 Tax=Paspalum notatum var. saurae TaxID=547442 RepID=A0AAQ3UEY2_PASNO
MGLIYGPDTWATYTYSNKNYAFRPKGDWFCPECVVNRLGLTSSRIECGAIGAQIFGSGFCGRKFLGTCNYLLVMGTSSDTESYARYYNHHDVVKVLQILALSDAYADIYRKIKENWKNLLGTVQSEISKIGKEGGVSHIPQSSMLSFTPTKAGDGNGWTTLKDGWDSKTVALPQTNAQKFVTNQYTMCSAEHLEEQKCMHSLDVVNDKNAEVYVNLYNHGNIAASAATSLAVITSDEANMEESLRGLLVGSLQDMQQKQLWYEQLERNIRGVAFSASWLSQ